MTDTTQKFQDMCTCGKRIYSSKQSAIKVMMKSKGNAGKRAYKCGRGHWHLTSQLLSGLRLTDTEINIIYALRTLREATSLPKKDNSKPERCHAAQKLFGLLLSQYLKESAQ